MPDQWNAMPARPLTRFVGRETEIRELRDALATARVIALVGRPGAGKTALASAVFAPLRDSSSRFASTLSIPAHGMSEQSLLDSISRSVGNPSVTPDVAQLPRTILDLAQAQQRDSLLLFLDNVEEEVATGRLFGQAMEALREQSAVTVMLTTRAEAKEMLFEGRLIDVAGIAEASARLDIIGTELRSRLTDDLLLQVAAQLGNLPQHLLYLRWSAPADVESFGERFTSEPELASIAAVRRVLLRIEGGDALIACGLLCRVDVSIELLAHLCAGTCGSPVDSLVGSAVREQILAVSPGSHGKSYQIHPSVHIDLARLAEERGRQWVRRVHELATEFYASALRVNTLDTVALQQHMHHLLAIREVGKAYEGVAGGALVERWRRAGLSIQLHEPLEALALAAADTPGALEQVQQAHVALIRAHIESDMGRPSDCLDRLAEAQRLVHHVVGDDAVELLRQTWVQSAISQGNLGNVDECIASYQRAIEADPNATRPETAACMGYLGYHYCDLLDFDTAKSWSELALEACPYDRDSAIFSRNLCNRALVHFYGGELSDARVLFEQAQELTGDLSSPAGDKREAGRVLLHLAMVYVAQSETDLELVRSTLTRAQMWCSQSGDARRSAIANSRLALVDALDANFGLATKGFEAASAAQLAVGDMRSLGLTLLCWTGVKYVQRFGAMPLTHETTYSKVEQDLPTAARTLVKSVLATAQGARLVRAWDERQRWLYFARFARDLPGWFTT